MTHPDPAGEPPRLSIRKIVVNLVGFAVGLALFVWIVRQAVVGGDWSLLAEHWQWVPVLVGCTALSAALNASTFWVTVQPLRRVSMADMQLLNIVANMLNYAPVRLGALARLAYHMRVDRMGFLQLAGWFAVIAAMLAVAVGACLVATVVRPEVDWLWLAIVMGLTAACGLAAQVLAGHRLVTRYGQGIDRIVTDDRALWGGLLLRLLDLGCYAARMAVAIRILDLHFATHQVVLLALVAIIAGLIPLGRLGFREACVALVAARLATVDDVEGTIAQLALIESMGEAAFFVPLGGVLLLWFRRKMKVEAEAELGPGP